MTQKHSLVFISVLVFGLSLCFIGNQPVRTEPETYLFTVTLIAPTNNPVSIQHAQMITNELPKVGIDVTLVLVGWDVFIPRVFEPPGPLALSYADGGYDMACVGWSGGLQPNTQFNYFHSTNTPDPNYFGVQNTTLDAMLAFTINTTDITQRKQYIEDAWQYLTWGLQAEITLYQTENVVYMRDNVKKYSSDLRVPGPLGVAEMYFEDSKSQGHGQVNDFIIASTTPPDQYNDLIENSYYNQMAIGPLNHGMVERDPDYNFIPVLLAQLPYPVAIRNNHTGIVSPTDPNFATVWEVELRNDVYWHEGYGYTMVSHADTLRVDSEDVNFTFQLILNDNGPSPCAERASRQYLLGDDANLAVVPVNRTHVQFHLRSLDADMLDKFTQKLLPKHILELGTVRADGSVAPSDYGDWNTDDWNVGARSGPYTGPAVIGNGPYILVGEDPISQTVTETKNPYWHLKDEPEYANMFDKYIYVWITSKDAALIALEQAEIDLMDPQFHAEIDYPVMKNKPSIFVQKLLDWGCQTMGINVVNGPGGLTDYRVRLAISHMCPRQDMVDYLLGGLGQPAFMHFPLQSHFYPTGVEPIVYNLTKAIEYMEAAGYNMDPFKDTTAPKVTSPPDQTYAEGTTGHNISWIATDDNPDNYTIYRNGTQLTMGAWTSGMAITVSIDGLAVGTYNYTITVTDSGLNSVTDTVMVTVTAPTTTPGFEEVSFLIGLLILSLGTLLYKRRKKAEKRE
ncbi:MAG: ABC transporter substrate-binding protein [Candidatus Hermodarchaeota archaeon]